MLVLPNTTPTTRLSRLHVKLLRALSKGAAWIFQGPCDLCRKQGISAAEVCSLNRCPTDMYVLHKVGFKTVAGYSRQFMMSVSDAESYDP